MKFTSEDLMKAMGLQVGDRIKVKLEIGLDFFNDSKNYVVEIFKDTTGIIMFKNDKNQSMFLTSLIGYDFEILPRPKRVGDLKCGTQGKDGQNTCSDCPVRIICNHHACKGLGCCNTLYEYLESYKTNFFEDDEDNVYDFDQEIYDLLKARLDKEVE